MMPSKRIKFVLAGMAAFTGVAFAQSSKLDFSENGNVATALEESYFESVRGNEAVALLRKRVKQVDWDEAPFIEVLDWMRDEGRGYVNIVPRWPNLNNEGVDEERLVTLRMRNVTVAEVLNETLAQLSLDDRLRYRATGNTIRISTQADFDRKFEARVYDVNDILFLVPNFQQEAPQIDLSQQNTQGGAGAAGGGGTGQSVFQQGGGGGSSQLGQQGGENDEQAIRRLEELRDAIYLVIAPETWRESPAAAGTGARGNIAIYNRSLMVYNTLEVHEQLAGWLEQR